MRKRALAAEAEAERLREKLVLAENKDNTALKQAYQQQAEKLLTMQTGTAQQKNTAQPTGTAQQKSTVQQKSVVQAMPLTSHQQGDMAVGGNLILGAGQSYSHFGIGAKFLYNVTAPIRLAGEFDYFPKQNLMSWWDLSVYGHYLFPVADKIALYPSVGLGMVGVSVNLNLGPYGNYSESTSDFAFSLGGGGDYELSSKLMLNLEVRCKIINSTRINIAAGVAYKFNR